MGMSAACCEMRSNHFRSHKEMGASKLAPMQGMVEGLVVTRFARLDLNRQCLWLDFLAVGEAHRDHTILMSRNRLFGVHGIRQPD